LWRVKVAKKNLPVAHGPCGALRVSFQILKFFADDSKMFENFSADSIFKKKFPLILNF
jgi:hypothetical protein